MTTGHEATVALSEPMRPRGLDHLYRQIRAEFIEMPGLRVTLRQAARLWHLEASTCAAVLEALVDDGFLSNAGGTSFRRTDG